jgi:hypothetical protein
MNNMELPPVFSGSREIGAVPPPEKSGDREPNKDRENKRGRLDKKEVEKKKTPDPLSQSGGKIDITI